MLLSAAENIFFTSPPGSAVGATPYVLLPEDPKVLGAGDRFEVYSGQYNEPELVFEILGFERGQQLIELGEPLPNSFGTLDFATDVAMPFARIRKIARNNFDEFKIQLNLWLALPANQARFFSDLNRFLNPLIVNENPTLAINIEREHD